MGAEKEVSIFGKEKTVDGFDNFATRVGLNNNNALSSSMYTFNLLSQNRIQLEAAYRGSWVVGKVIDAVAEDMTKAGIEVTTHEAEKDLKKFYVGMRRLSIWPSLCAGIKWGRLYGGALAVLNIEGQDMSTPLNIDSVTKDQFSGLIIFDRWQLNPIINDAVESGPDLGLPKAYQIVNDPRITLTGAPLAGGGMVVHHTRVIRLTGIDFPYFQAIGELMWGESLLERLWDRLMAFDNATMSSANLIEHANNRTVSVDGLREILAAGGQAQAGLEAQFAMMQVFQTNQGITLLDKNDTFQSTQYSFSGLSDLLLQFGQQLSGASDIPLVRLFGQSPAGLSATGESDLRMYYDTINAQQNAKLSLGMEKIVQVMWRSIFSRPAPDDLEFTFVPLWQMSALDKASIAKTNSETISGIQEAGLISAKCAMQELRGKAAETGLFSNITDEDIENADDAPPAPEPDQESQPADIPDADQDPAEKTLSLVRSMDKKPGVWATFARSIGLTHE